MQDHLKRRLDELLPSSLCSVFRIVESVAPPASSTIAGSAPSITVLCAQISRAAW